MSNETPSSATKKTASARRFLVFSVLLVGIAGLIVAAAITLSAQQAASERTGKTWLKLGAQHYDIVVADTQEARERGLSGRSQLESNEAMLFVFSEPDTRCFWMQNMQFSIDMIWLDAQKQVVHIERAVTPETYPKQFCGNGKAQYVLETAANVSNAKAGMRAYFDL